MRAEPTPPAPEEFVLSPDARLILDAGGLHLRRLPPMVDLGGPWDDLYAVSVARADGPPRVSVTFVDGLARLAEGRSPATATRFDLPPSADHAPEELVAAIERFRRARRDATP